MPLIRPGALNPQLVPTVPVEIDWTHPLSQGLTWLMIPGSPHGFADIVGNYPRLIPSSTNYLIVPSSEGPVASATVAGDTGASVFIGNNPHGLTSAGTILWNGRINSSAISSGTQIAGVQSSAGYDYYFGFGVGGSPATYSAVAWLGSTGYSSSSSTWAVGHQRAIAAFTAPGTLGFWVNGALVSNNTTLPAGSVPFDGNTYLVNNIIMYNTGFGTYQNTAQIAMWNQELSSGLIQWLSAEPFAMLRPIRRRMFYGVASGSSVSNIAGRSYVVIVNRALTSASATMAGESQNIEPARAGISAAASLTGRSASIATDRGVPSGSATTSGRASAATSDRGTTTSAAATSGQTSIVATDRGPLLANAIIRTTAGRASSVSTATGSLTASANLAGRASAETQERGALGAVASTAGRAISVATGRAVLYSGAIVRLISGRASSITTARGALTAISTASGRAAAASPIRSLGALASAIAGRVATWFRGSGSLTNNPFPYGSNDALPILFVGAGRVVTIKARTSMRITLFPPAQTAPPMVPGQISDLLLDFSADIAANAPTGTVITTYILGTPSPSGLSVLGSSLNGTSTGILVRLTGVTAGVTYALTVTVTYSDAAGTVLPRTVYIPVVATLG